MNIFPWFPGTMSGGGSRVCKGRMGSVVVEEFDPKKLEQLESKLAKVSVEPLLSELC